MKTLMIIFGVLLSFFLTSLLWFKAESSDVFLLRICAYALVVSEISFFYCSIKYYTKKGYQLKARVPQIIAFPSLFLMYYFGQKYFIEKGASENLYYNIALILFAVLASVKAFFELKKPNDSQPNL